MSNFLENTICQSHQMQTIAVDLNPHIEIEKKQLCVKCLAIRASSNHQIVLNEEFKAIVKEIKINEFEKQRRIFEESQSNYNQIQSKKENNQELLKANINKTLTLIKNYIEDQKKRFEQILEPDDSINQQDLLIFNQISKKNSVLSTQSSIQNQTDKDQEFQKILYEQLRNLYPEDSYLEIIKLVDQTSESNQSKESLLDIYSYYQNSKKTPFLKHLCSKHNKEIVMFSLSEECQEERLLCIDCIPKFQHKVITLEDTNKLWMMHQGEQYDNQNKFLTERESKYLQLQKIIQENEGKYKKFQNDIQQLIETQNQNIANQVNDLYSKNVKQSLMQLELKDLKVTIKQLSQKDKFNQLKQQQKLIEDDQLFQNEILKKQCDIENLQQVCKQQLLKLFGSNDSFIQEYQIEIDRFQKEIDQLDSGLFTNLMPKFQNEFYQSLLILMKGISDKGHKQIEQLNNSDYKINNKEQEQININKYKDILHQFDRQYKIIRNQIDQKDNSTQINNNLKVNSQIINFAKEISQQRQLSINTINSLQIQQRIIKLRLQDQLNKTNKNLNVISQIIVVPKQLMKQKLLQISRQLQTTWSNRPYYAKLLKFSTVFKHSSITISADGKTAKQTIKDWCLCLCDQPIPKFVTVGVNFSVKQLYSFQAGVCLIDSINKDYGYSGGIDNGCYFLYQDGYIFFSPGQRKKWLIIRLPNRIK